MDSFASRFHRRLREKHRISTVVYARIHCVGIGNPADEAGDPSVHGHKGTFDDNDTGSGWTGGGAHRIHSKLKFCWEGGTQRLDWAY